MKGSLNQYSDVTLQTEDLHIKLMFDSAIIRKADRAAGSGIGRLHAHQYYELFYVEQGSIQVVFADRTVQLEPGDMLIIPPELLHHSVSTDPGHLRYNLAFTILDPAATTDAFRFLFHIASPLSVGQGDIPEAFRRLYRYYTGDHPEKRQLIASAVHEILYLARHAAGAQHEHPQAHGLTPVNREYRAYIIDNYINSNFAGDITLGRLAELLYLSPHQANRLVRQLHGRSFLQYVIYLRMTNAAKLLRETKLKVKDIAALVGYTSAHGFYAMFAKTWGMTPEEYRGSQ